MFFGCALNCKAVIHPTPNALPLQMSSHTCQSRGKTILTVVFAMCFSICNGRVAFKPLIWHKPLLYRIQCVYIVVPPKRKLNEDRMSHDVPHTNLTPGSFGQALCNTAKNYFTIHGVTCAVMDVVWDDESPPGKPRCCNKLYKSSSLNFTSIFCIRLRFPFSSFISRPNVLASFSFCHAVPANSEAWRPLGHLFHCLFFCFGKLLAPLVLRRPHSSPPRSAGFRQGVAVALQGDLGRWLRFYFSSDIARRLHLL